MTEVVRWWTRRAAAAAAEPTLGGALLGHRWPRYALRRLRGFVITRAAAIALHVAEALLVAQTLAGDQLVLGLVLASAMPLVTGAWWGATEVLRARVRALHAHGDHGGADLEVRTWLTWSVRFGALVMLGALAFAWSHRSAPVLACWGAVLIGRAGLDLPLRVWHARIGARRRVFRPMGLQLAVEVAGPLVIVLGAGSLGPVVVLLAALASTIAARAVTGVVLARAYAQDGRPWPWPRLRAPGLPWRAVAWHALAGAALRLPSVLAIPLVLAPGLPPHVAVGVHLSLGALAAASGWPWAHYHDLLAVQARPLHRLRGCLERTLLLEAAIVGALVGALVLALALALTPSSLPFHPEPGVFVLIPPRLPAARPFVWVLPLIAAGVALLSAAQAIAWVRGQRAAILVGAVAVALAAAWADRLPRLVYGHGYVGDHPPAPWIRTIHAGIAVALAVVTLATCAWLARRPRLAARGELPWLVGQEVAARQSAVVVTLARGGAIAEHATARLVAGAACWARGGRAVLVVGVDEAEVRRRAAATGWAARVEAWRPRAMAMDAEAGDVTVRLGWRPRPSQRLGAHEAEAVWRALLAAADGRPAERGARVRAYRAPGGVLDEAVVRVRPER